MSDLLQKLKKNQRTGSKPRCHWITHGSRREVADRLTDLIKPWGELSENDFWSPQGFEQTSEAELHVEARLYRDPVHCTTVREWWFKNYRGRQTGPSFDIATTCTIGGRNGIALVEAKAHDGELMAEERGKPLGEAATTGQLQNHNHIGVAVHSINAPLTAATGHPWSLSSDNRYQMSNRFASAFKLTELGYPVILVYLGFLNAEEMRNPGRKPIASHEAWSSLVLAHSAPLFPGEIWNVAWSVNDQQLVPIIRSIEISHDKPHEAKVGRELDARYRA